MARKKNTPTQKKSKTRKANARSTSRRTTTKKKPTRGGTSSRRTSKPSTRRSTTRKTTSRKKSPRDLRLNLQQKGLIVGIGIIFITAVLVLSLLSPNQGQLTTALAGLMWRTFGWGGVIIPVVTGAIGLYLVLWGMDQAPKLPVYRLSGIGLFFLTFETFTSLSQKMLNNGLSDVWLVAQAQRGGGYLGGIFAFILEQAIGTLGTIFVLVVIGIIATILASGVTRKDLGHLLSTLTRGRSEGETVPTSSGRNISINPGRSPRPIDSQVAPVQPPLIPEPNTKQEPAVEPRQASRPKPAERKTQRDTTATPPPAQESPPLPPPIFLGNVGVQSVRSWTLPVLSELLESGTEHDLNNETIREQVEIIEHTLDSFGAPASVVEINQGPAITQFGVEPNFIEQRSGKRTKVKVGKIASLSDDLALALAAQAIRIQAPVPGKGYVGIEVPNVTKSMVSLRDVMESKDYQKIKSPLRIGLGQNVAGQPIATDLASMPHLLIAGTTGSGKSVCVNSIIACLLLQNTPDELKIVMVDPKRVELTGYNGIPHLAAPVVVEMDRVIGTLQWAMREMEKRYKMFSEIGARNIIDYNKKIQGKKDKEKLAYIVIVIDELADLMMLSPEETERGVTRLAQMARATGIHMIIATQRPSVDVVTGLIKANFPARIAFAVASSTDSRVILDTTGAERLLGQGDMLFQSPDAAAPVRLQGCFVSDKELGDLIEYWKMARRFSIITAESSITTRSEAMTVPDQIDETFEIDEIIEAPPPLEEPRVQPLWEELQKAEEEAKYEDELMPEAIAMVRKLNKASTSLLQRRFRIGYTRAARLIDAMEDEGIIGPPTGTSKAREVLPWENGEENPETEEEEIEDET